MPEHKLYSINKSSLNNSYQMIHGEDSILPEDIKSDELHAHIAATYISEIQQNKVLRGNHHDTLRTLSGSFFGGGYIRVFVQNDDVNNNYDVYIERVTFFRAWLTSRNTSRFLNISVISHLCGHANKSITDITKYLSQKNSAQACINTNDIQYIFSNSLLTVSNNNDMLEQYHTTFGHDSSEPTEIINRNSDNNRHRIEALSRTLSICNDFLTSTSCSASSEIEFLKWREGLSELRKQYHQQQESSYNGQLERLTDHYDTLKDTFKNALEKSYKTNRVLNGIPQADMDHMQDVILKCAMDDPIIYSVMQNNHDDNSMRYALYLAHNKYWEQTFIELSSIAVNMLDEVSYDLNNCVANIQGIDTNGLDNGGYDVEFGFSTLTYAIAPIARFASGAINIITGWRKKKLADNALSAYNSFKLNYGSHILAIMMLRKKIEQMQQCHSHVNDQKIHEFEALINKSKDIIGKMEEQNNVIDTIHETYHEMLTSSHEDYIYGATRIGTAISMAVRCILSILMTVGIVNVTTLTTWISNAFGLIGAGGVMPLALAGACLSIRTALQKRTKEKHAALLYEDYLDQIQAKELELAGEYASERRDAVKIKNLEKTINDYKYYQAFICSYCEAQNSTQAVVTATVNWGLVISCAIGIITVIVASAMTLFWVTIAISIVAGLASLIVWSICFAYNLHKRRNNEKLYRVITTAEGHDYTNAVLSIREPFVKKTRNLILNKTVIWMIKQNISEKLLDEVKFESSQDCLQNFLQIFNNQLLQCDNLSDDKKNHLIEKFNRQMLVTIEKECSTLGQDTYSMQRFFLEYAIILLNNIADDEDICFISDENSTSDLFNQFNDPSNKEKIVAYVSAMIDQEHRDVQGDDGDTHAENLKSEVDELQDYDSAITLFQTLSEKIDCYSRLNVDRCIADYLMLNSLDHSLKILHVHHIFQQFQIETTEETTEVKAQKKENVQLKELFNRILPNDHLQEGEKLYHQFISCTSELDSSNLQLASIRRKLA